MLPFTEGAVASTDTQIILGVREVLQAEEQRSQGKGTSYTKTWVFWGTIRAACNWTVDVRTGSRALLRKKALLLPLLLEEVQAPSDLGGAGWGGTWVCGWSSGQTSAWRTDTFWYPHHIPESTQSSVPAAILTRFGEVRLVTAASLTLLIAFHPRALPQPGIGGTLGQHSPSEREEVDYISTSHPASWQFWRLSTDPWKAELNGHSTKCKSEHFSTAFLVSLAPSVCSLVPIP